MGAPSAGQGSRLRWQGPTRPGAGKGRGRGGAPHPAHLAGVQGPGRPELGTCGRRPDTAWWPSRGWLQTHRHTVTGPDRRPQAAARTGTPWKEWRGTKAQTATRRVQGSSGPRRGGPPGPLCSGVTRRTGRRRSSWPSRPGRAGRQLSRGRVAFQAFQHLHRPGSAGQQGGGEGHGQVGPRPLPSSQLPHRGHPQPGLAPAGSSWD